MVQNGSKSDRKVPGRAWRTQESPGRPPKIHILRMVTETHKPRTTQESSGGSQKYTPRMATEIHKPSRAQESPGRPPKIYT